MTRLALLTEIPAPYRLALFRALAGRERIELRVLFLAASDPRRSYPPPGESPGFDFAVLSGLGIGRRGRWLVLNRRVRASLAAFGPSAIVVGGWNQPAFWSALAFGRKRRIPVVAWVESTARDARSGRGARVKRAFLDACAAFLVPGSAAAGYLRELGVGGERIVVAPNASDLAAPAGRRPHEGCRLLYAGRLAPEKGLDVLFRAIAGLPVELAVAGSGPEEERLRASAPPNARFLGQLDRSALAAAYASADVFVLPSRSEPWGMVLNEAAAAGLALVATDAAGAAHDLIEDGVNGFRVPAGDAAALREALLRLAEDQALRAAMGERSRALAARFTPEAWAAAVEELVLTLPSRRR